VIRSNQFNPACLRRFFAATISFALMMGVPAGIVFGQEVPRGGAAVASPETEVDATEIAAIMADESQAAEVPESTPSGIDLLTLISRGGAFMIPIAIMSFLVVALAVERMVMLRRRKILPPKLIERLQALSEPVERFNPTAAMQACEQYRSPAGRVVQAMLLRTGQPLADVERAAAESISREAESYASPIRWLTLAAAATPLMGLLGTVWGMIVAFHESTTLTAGRSRSEQLSEGIYTALVTTLAGLAVAIPAAILALYLENRLIRLFHQIEKLAFEIAPGLARFTGRRRIDSDGVLHTMDASSFPSPSSTSAATAAPRTASPSRGEAKTG